MTETPKADVNTMFQKMGEKLGWFEYKDLDSAIKTLSSKTKHNKSRLKLKSKDEKENTPARNKNKSDSITGKNLRPIQPPLREIQTDSSPPRREIPLRKSPANWDLTQEARADDLYNTSVISPCPDGEVFSILEDVGMPLIESTRIHSRQSIDAFGLSINEETGENDSYEDLRIKNKKADKKRISDLYVTAVESQDDYYSVIDIATQTVTGSGSSVNESNKLNDHDSTSSDASIYEVKDMGIQTDKTSDGSINQSPDDLCDEFDQSLSLVNSETDLILRLEVTDSLQSLTTSQKQDGVSSLKTSQPQMYIAESNNSNTSVKTSGEIQTSNRIKQTPKSTLLKSKIMKNKITVSDSESDDDFKTAKKALPSSGRRKHQLYTPSNESFLSPLNDKPSSKMDDQKSVAKMKALLSSDSDDDLPKTGVKKSKYFTPKSVRPTKFSDSDDSLPDIDQVRCKVRSEKPSSSWRSNKRLPSESSEDDDLDKFLKSVKTPVKPPVVYTKSLDEFIVDDDISISSGSESEEEIFYISTQSPKNRGCTLLRSPVSRITTPSVVDVNLPVSQRLKTPSTLTRQPSSVPTSSSTGSSDVFKTPHRPKVKSTISSLSEKSSLKTQSNESSSKPYSFMRSLSLDIPEHRRHPDSLKYIKQFKKNQEELSIKLFQLFNQTVFDSKLPEDMNIIWNKRLLRTAGYCAYKRVNGKHVARVELSTKVCDTTERVRDTLIHELCHAAVWMLNQRTDGHGPYWKYWARKSNVSHPELPVISRCHSYSITTKYTYICTQCGYKVGRHSKSLDTDKKVCGHCHGRFQLADTPGSRGGTPKTPNKFAMFVKDNYGSAKKGNSNLKHKDIMQLLSQQFAVKIKLDSA